MHVPSKANPADLISRGSTPQDLARCPSWWHGPTWLTLPRDQWPAQAPVQSRDTSELKHCHVVVATNDLAEDILTKSDSYTRTVRTIAYVLIFINNSKPKQATCKRTSPLAPTEIDDALVTCIKLLQANAYASEINALQQDQPVPAASFVLSLRPFLDARGLLRVGGRLRNALFALRRQASNVASQPMSLCRNLC